MLFFLIFRCFDYKSEHDFLHDRNTLTVSFAIIAFRLLVRKKSDDVTSSGNVEKTTFGTFLISMQLAEQCFSESKAIVSSGQSYRFLPEKQCFFKRKRHVYF